MKPFASKAASSIYFNFKPELQNSTEPSKIRTDFENSLGIMLDCAEGTYGQIYDHFQGMC